jgi:DNA polymerase-1
MNDRLREIFNQVEQERDHGITSDKNSHVLIVDGLNLFIRVFSAVPALNDDGDHVGGVVGFLKSLAALIRQVKPTRCIVVFDGKGGSRRRKDIYPDYKANRANKTAFNRYQEFASLTDEKESMKRQYGRMIQYLNDLPLTLLAIDNVEADDIVAYIATDIYNQPDQRITISSTDRDFLQLVDDRINVWSPVKKILYTPAVMKEEFGFPSNNYLLYRTIAGDPSDNIPGLKGVGIKTLIKRFPEIAGPNELDVDTLIELAEQAEQKYKVHSIISENRELLELNYELMQLKSVNIDGRSKSIARDIVLRDIQSLNAYEFKKRFMADKLYTAIKDLDSWMRDSFSTLNSYASI